MRPDRWLRAVAVLCVALACAGVARAYVLIKDKSGIYVITWAQSPIAMQVKLPTTGALSDGTTQAGSVLAAAQRWNQELGTVQFALESVGPGPYANGNGVNEIVMDSKVDGDAFPANALAVTMSYTSGNNRTESDIVFNSAIAWDSYRSYLRGPYDIRRVALHELGHVLGLDHPDESGQTVTAVMNSHVSDIDGLMGDDISGAQALYGAPGFTPPNDSFAKATVLALGAGNTATVTGTNIAASREPGEPNHADAPQGHSVWWKWTAPLNGAATITTLGSDFDTVLAIYTGSSVGALTTVASNDDVQDGVIRTSTVTFDAVGGTTYYIAVDGWANDQGRGGYTGTITLNLAFTGVPTAPFFATQPAAQTLAAGTTAFFAIGAQGTSGITYRWQRLPAAGGDWADVVAGGSYFINASSGTLQVNTTFAMDGDQFRCIATNGVGSTTSSPALLHVTPIPLPVIVAQPRDATIFAASGGGISVNASGATGYQWYHANGVAVPGATSSVLLLNQAQVSDSGSYYVAVSNAGGTVLSQPVTLTVNPVLGVVAIYPTETYTLFLRADGSRWASGYEYIWQFGSNANVPRPANVTPDQVNVIGAAAGRMHALFIKPDGTLWAHGENGHGQLGDGTKTQRFQPVQVATGVVAVAAGGDVSYFIKSDGTLWGMGNNGSGLLADGTYEDRASPVPIAQSVSAVWANDLDTLFLKSDGTLWGMGTNYNGALGIGDTTDFGARTMPIASGVVSAAVGAYASYFIKTDGTAWAMGDNSLGELGDGTNLARRTPVKIMSNVTAVAAGYEHALFLKSDRTLWITGDVSVQFGNPALTVRNTPVQVATDVAFMAGGVSTTHYVKTDGSVWATGSNQYGKLGVGRGEEVLDAPLKVNQDPLAVPPPLTGLQATSGSAGTAPLLRWTASTAASRYEIWRNPTNNLAGAGILATLPNPLGYDPYTVGGSYYYWVRAVNPAGAGNFSAPIRAGGSPTILAPPVNATAAAGQSATFAVTTAGGASVQWERNGVALAGATSPTLMVANVQPSQAGLYGAKVTSSSGAAAAELAILGVASTSKVIGDGAEVGANIVHANGNVYDQVLLQGTAATITADRGEVVRLSYVDLTDDIVQVEFSGAGALTITLEQSSGPAPAVNYNQPGVSYMRGHASIVVSGADQTTNLSVFSVGTLTAVNQALFRGDVSYDGMADLAFVAISSANGKFGGLRTANASFLATKGAAGVYAPGVQFTGPVRVGNIAAFDAATPYLVLGRATDVRITGGDLLQPNGRAVQVDGFDYLQMDAGTNSHNQPQPGQPLRGRLEQGGIDVTQRLTTPTIPINVIPTG